MQQNYHSTHFFLNSGFFVFAQKKNSTIPESHLLYVKVVEDLGEGLLQHSCSRVGTHKPTH